MTKTKTIAIFLLIAIATVGVIGIGIGTAQAMRWGGYAPGQNDNSQGNNNIQGATSCSGWRLPPACGENPQGNQP